MNGHNSIVLEGIISHPNVIKFSLDGIELSQNIEFYLRTQHRAKKIDEWLTIDDWHLIRVRDTKLVSRAEAAKLKKGQTLFVTGSLQYDSWIDSDGKNHKKAVIIANRFEICARPTRKPVSPENPPEDNQHQDENTRTVAA